MKKQIKSLLSVALAFVLSLSINPTFAFASCTDDNSTSVTAQASDETEKGLELTEKLGFGKEYLQSISLDEDQSLVYNFNINGLISAIKPVETDTAIIYDITEGSRHNILTTYNDGRITVDGIAVEVSQKESPIMLRDAGYVNDYWTQDCPYGTAADYASYVDKESDADINFHQAIGNLATATLAGILMLNIDALAGLLVSTSMGLAGLMQDENPSSSAASYIGYIYVHTVKGYWVRNSADALGVKKHSMYLYSLPDFQGNATHIDAYECRSFN